MEGQLLYDISPPISPSMAVWPGDTPLSREVLLDMHRGDHLTLSTLRSTVHLGAHVDAPSHYGADDPTIDARSLDYYLGACEVVQVDVEPGSRVKIGDLPGKRQTPRLLIATCSYPDPESFQEDYIALEPDLVDHLHAQGIMTVGIDTPSVDLFSSTDLPAHKRFLANDMAIIEGLVLTDVPAGVYELIALPLKLVGFDASPVRAVLRSGAS